MTEIPKYSDLYVVAQLNAGPVDRIPGISLSYLATMSSGALEPVQGFMDPQIQGTTSEGELNQAGSLVDSVFSHEARLITRQLERRTEE